MLSALVRVRSKVADVNPLTKSCLFLPRFRRVWSSPRNTTSDEAGSDRNFNDPSDTRHAFNSLLSSFFGFATVPILRMGRASLDSVSAAGAVKSTGRAAVGGGVLTLL